MPVNGLRSAHACVGCVKASPASGSSCAAGNVAGKVDGSVADGSTAKAAADDSDVTAAASATAAGDGGEGGKGLLSPAPTVGDTTLEHAALLHASQRYQLHCRQSKTSDPADTSPLQPSQIPRCALHQARACPWGHRRHGLRVCWGEGFSGRRATGFVCGCSGTRETTFLDAPKKLAKDFDAGGGGFANLPFVEAAAPFMGEVPSASLSPAPTSPARMAFPCTLR